jgi:hypothetical protein
MRHRLSSLPRPVVAGVLIFLMAFGLYATTTWELPGYEPETAAVTEGFVQEGHFWDVEDSALPSLRAYLPGKGGHLYARAGLLQPLLEAPFFAAGHFVDGHFGWTEPYPYRLVFLWFYNPFIAALAAVALFAFVYLIRGSLTWAVVVAALFTGASIAWPYSKIGMETTFMFALLTAFALAAWARRKTTAGPWAAVGFAAGAMAATKPYAGVLVIPLAIYLWPAWISLDRRWRLRTLIAAAVPALLWVIAIGWYNWDRFGSVTDFGYTEFALTLSMPLNVLGLIFSPGKGLLFYSPLVVIGALGLPAMWREDRWLTAALLTALLILACLSGASTYWGDEVWGPRYLVPAAWALLVPIAWWTTTSIRRRVLVGVTVVAVLVQVIGVSAYYGTYIQVVQKLTGVAVYGDRFSEVDPENIPYGDDPTRWIPELSPLLLQAEGLISTEVVSRFGGKGLEATYDPFEGRSRTVNLSEPEVRMELNFFWNNLFGVTRAKVFAALMFLMSLASGFGLYRLVKTGPERPRRSRV